MSNKPSLSDPIDVTEADVDEAIATCDGDPRAAIKALLVEATFLERLLSIAREEASRGYVRGKRRREG